MNQPIKKYKLELTVYGVEGEFSSYDKIESDSLVEALSQLPLIIATLVTNEKKHEKTSYILGTDDDIPF